MVVIPFRMAYLEPLAALLSVWSIGLIIRRNVWGFPVGIISVALYAWVFYNARLYSDMLLQFAFVAFQVHGWVHWYGSPVDADDRRIRLRRLSAGQWARSLLIGVAGAWTLGTVMAAHTNAAIPFLDAGTTTVSLLAQWWMNRRYVESWLLWIAVDAVYLYQYSSQQLYYTAALYAIFLGMAFWGWFTWRKRR